MKASESRSWLIRYRRQSALSSRAICCLERPAAPTIASSRLASCMPVEAAQLASQPRFESRFQGIPGIADADRITKHARFDIVGGLA